MSAARISVIITTYNGAATIEQAVASVRGTPQVEIIIVVDGSTDRTAEVLAALPNVITIRQENAGPSAARNAGLKRATAPRIAFLDDDDVAMECRLTVLDEMLDRDPGVSVALGYSAFSSEGGEERPASPVLMYHLGAALFRREFFDRFGRFDTSIRASEDVDIFLRALDAGERFAITDRLVQIVRRNGENMTAGKSLHDLDFMRVLKRSLDRRRGTGS